MATGLYKITGPSIEIRMGETRIHRPQHTVYRKKKTIFTAWASYDG